MLGIWIHFQAAVSKSFYSLLEKVYSKRKEIAPKESNYFALRVDRFSQGRQFLISFRIEKLEESWLSHAVLTGKNDGMPNFRSVKLFTTSSNPF